jgi:methyl halide transferase
VTSQPPNQPPNQPPKPNLSPDAWNERYQNEDTPWDLSGPTPEFARLLREGRLPTKGRVLVPGGGRGHDAVLFAQKGFEVDLVDFAPKALEAALGEASKQKATVFAYRQDFFELPSLPYHASTYDILLEYTFFCAIDPDRRKDYVRAAAALLKPGGWLVGLFFPLEITKAGPPFLVSEKEVRELFAPHFELTIEKPRESVKAREGREFLGLFRRK